MMLQVLLLLAATAQGQSLLPEKTTGNSIASVVSVEGEPVAPVGVWGRSTCNFDGTSGGIMGTTPDDAQYRSRIESHFNTIVFENDLKWAPGNRPQYSRN